MATIIKYVNETIHIVDKSYIPKKVRIYKTEQIDIQEIIYKYINKPLTAQNYFGTWKFCKTDIQILPFCSIFGSNISFNCPNQYIDNVNAGIIQQPIINNDYFNQWNNTGSVNVHTLYPDEILNTYLNKIQENINNCNLNNSVNSTCFINKFEYKNTIKTSTTKFEFNLGVVSKPIVIPVTLTSTYNEDLTLTNITSDFGLGVELQDINVGYILPAHGTLSFKFKVKLEGKSIIDNNYLYFHFNNGLIIRWKWCFIRQISILYYMFPNKNSYKETFYYFSKTFRSLGGREDVIPFINIPKQSFSAAYSFLPIDIKNYLLNLSYKNEYDENLYPMWSEFTTPTSTQTKTNVIQVERISDFIKKGSLIVLINKYNEKEYMIAQVTNIYYEDNKLELNFKVDYNKDTTLIIPLISVIINNDTNLRYYNIKDTNITLNVRTLK